MELRGKARPTCASELVGVDPRDKLGLDRGLQDASRLGHRKVALVAEDVAEPSPRLVGVLTPLSHLFRVSAKPRPAIGRKRVRGEERHLDPGQVLARTQTRKHAHRLELALATEVIAGPRLDRSRT